MKKMFLAVAWAAAFAFVSRPAAAVFNRMESALQNINQEFVNAWNAHDAKKMASLWAEKGDLMNPFGQKGSGRDGVETIFQTEQTGVMKTSSIKIQAFSTRQLNADAVLGDWDGVITGIVDPEGKAQPPFAFHAAVLYAKIGGHWQIWAARAWQIPPAPAAAAK